MTTLSIRVPFHPVASHSRNKQYQSIQKIAYTTSEVMRVASISRTKLQEELKNGKLVCRKLGRKNVYLHADVVSWLKSLPANGTDQQGSETEL